MGGREPAVPGAGGVAVNFRQAWLSLFAGLCGVVAAWPLTTLIDGGSWIADSVALVALAIAVGILGRAARLPEFLVVWIQFALTFVALWFMYIRGADVATFDALAALVQEADSTIRKFAAPAPETPGLRFAVTALIVMLTILIDVLAVGLRSPALAGLPIMSIYLISAANTTEGLPAHFFLATAGCWLVMVGLAARSDVLQWSNTTARATQPTLLGDRLGLGGFASVARTVGVLALAGALVVPHVLPSTDQRFFADGLGRRPGGGTGTVGLSSTLDVSRSLVSNDRTPVVTFTTDDPAPAPLRVMTSSSYQDGQWSRQEPAATLPGSDRAPMQQPAGLLRSAGYVEQSFRIRSSTLRPGLLAAPTPTLRADLEDVTWSYDPETSVILPRESAAQYTVSYARLGPSARPSGTQEPEGFERDLAIDPRALPELRRAADRIPKAATPYNRAIAIQDYLRTGGGFTYSLTLLPTRRAANGAAVDPLTNFLLTKQGYCVQFATAMIMLARLERIPARMAIGFLPGSPQPGQANNTQYTVLQSDAHAWPELYFPGLGWTRFEPTPGSRSGSVPVYTVPDTPAPSRTERPDTTSSTTTASGETTRAGATTTAAPADPSGGEQTTILGSALKYLGWLVLAALVLGLLGSLLPFVARREAERLRRTSNSHERIEAEWAAFRDDLHDLGVPGAPGLSPRAEQQHYRRAGALSGEPAQALDRATATLERWRYGEPDANLDLAPDLAEVVQAVERNAAFRNRVVHRLAPRSGRRWLLRAIQPWRKR